MEEKAILNEEDIVNPKEEVHEKVSDDRHKKER